MEKALVLHGKTFRPFISNAQIEKAIDTVAQRLNQDYSDSSQTEPPIVLCTLTGAIMFTSELMKRISFPAEFQAIKLSSYEGTQSTGHVRQEGLLGNVSGRRVLVVEDIVDTGNTIEALEGILKDAGAADIRICSLLLKKDVYKKNIPIDYVAMEIPSRFIVGFGLDYDGLGRNTSDIYVID